MGKKKKKKDDKMNPKPNVYFPKCTTPTGTVIVPAEHMVCQR